MIRDWIRGGMIALLGFLLLAGCGKEEVGAESRELRIGTSPGDFADMVRDYIGPELQKRGYQVSLVELSDIIAPNIGVVEGHLELNIYQHKPYLDEFNENSGASLIPIVQVPTAPFGLYGGRLNSLEAIRSGSTVGVPSNITNYSRGLRIMEALGWIQLKEGLDPFQVSHNDITANPLGLKIVEIDAPQLVRARADLDYVVINGNYAQDAGIPASEALHIEPSKAYVNWVVIDAKNRERPWAAAVVEIVNSEGFKAYTAEQYPGYNLPLSWESED